MQIEPNPTSQIPQVNVPTCSQTRPSISSDQKNKISHACATSREAAFEGQWVMRAIKVQAALELKIANVPTVA